MIKKFIQKFLFAVTLMTSLYSLGYAVSYRVEDQPAVIEQVVQIEQKGILKQKKNGYLYLDVSNDFITQGLPLIDAPEKINPPSHYTMKRGIGAHISVMYEDERVSNELWEIEELGQEFTFSVMDLRTVRQFKNDKVQKLWLIAVEAPELEALREKYGLRPFLNRNDFHITIGIQILNNQQKFNSTKPKHGRDMFLKEAA